MVLNIKRYLTKIVNHAIHQAVPVVEMFEVSPITEAEEKFRFDYLTSAPKIIFNSNKKYPENHAFGLYSMKEVGDEIRVHLARHQHLRKVEALFGGELKIRLEDFFITEQLESYVKNERSPSHKPKKIAIVVPAPTNLSRLESDYFRCINHAEKLLRLHLRLGNQVDVIVPYHDSKTAAAIEPFNLLFPQLHIQLENYEPNQEYTTELLQSNSSLLEALQKIDRILKDKTVLQNIVSLLLCLTKTGKAEKYTEYIIVSGGVNEGIVSEIVDQTSKLLSKPPIFQEYYVGSLLALKNEKYKGLTFLQLAERIASSEIPLKSFKAFDFLNSCRKPFLFDEQSVKLFDEQYLSFIGNQRGQIGGWMTSETTNRQNAQEVEDEEHFDDLTRQVALNIVREQEMIEESLEKKQLFQLFDYYETQFKKFNGLLKNEENIQLTHQIELVKSGMIRQIDAFNQIFVD